jgi:hypothetical protein
MKKNRMRWFQLILGIAIGSMCSTCARAEWSFTGDRLIDNFDGEVFPGWSPPPHPGGPGLETEKAGRRSLAAEKLPGDESSKKGGFLACLTAS